MDYLKNIILSILIMLGIILFIPLFISILSYFGLINTKITSILKIITIIVSFLTGGYLIGKKSSKKGYLEGLKLSIIFLIIITLFNILGLDNGIKLKNILYYSILMIACMFGSMIGINKNKTN